MIRASTIDQAGKSLAYRAVHRDQSKTRDQCKTRDNDG